MKELHEKRRQMGVVDIDPVPGQPIMYPMDYNEQYLRGFDDMWIELTERTFDVYDSYREIQDKAASIRNRYNEEPFVYKDRYLEGVASASLSAEGAFSECHGTYMTFFGLN